MGRMNGLATRLRVYRFDEGLEVDDIDHYEITRKRVFFDDVLAVTYHRSATWGYVIATAIPGLLALTIGMLIAIFSVKKEGAIVFAVIGLLGLLPAVLRLILKLDVITVFGRRTKATMVFAFRKAKARRVHLEILTAVRKEQQARAHQKLPAEQPPAADVPSPYPLPDDIAKPIP